MRHSSRMRSCFQLPVAVLVLATGSCKTDPVVADAGPQLRYLKFTSYMFTPAAGKFSGNQAGGKSSFDPMTFSDIGPGRFWTATSFTLQGQPVQPQPTEILVNASVPSHQFARIVRAGKDHFIASVEATLVDENTLMVHARQEDGAPATVTNKE